MENVNRCNEFFVNFSICTYIVSKELTERVGTRNAKFFNYLGVYGHVQIVINESYVTRTN